MSRAPFAAVGKPVTLDRGPQAWLDKTNRALNDARARGVLDTPGATLFNRPGNST